MLLHEDNENGSFGEELKSLHGWGHTSKHDCKITLWWGQDGYHESWLHFSLFFLLFLHVYNPEGFTIPHTLMGCSLTKPLNPFCCEFPHSSTSQSTVSILGPLSPWKEEKKRHIIHWSKMPELVGGLQERAAHWLQLPYTMPKVMPIPQRLYPKAITKVCPFGPSQDSYEGPFCF